MYELQGLRENLLRGQHAIGVLPDGAEVRVAYGMRKDEWLLVIESHAYRAMSWQALLVLCGRLGVIKWRGSAAEGVVAAV